MAIAPEKADFKVISPISIFGPVELFVLMYHYDSLIEVCETYQKRSIRNRTRILSANGPLLLTVPLEKGKTKTAIKEVRISYGENWIKDYLEGLRSAYANAPYFDYYFPDLEIIIKEKPIFLFDLFESSMSLLKKWIPLKPMAYTSSFQKEYRKSADLRVNKPDTYVKLRSYTQVFSEKFPFTGMLSILDLLFNLGPESTVILADSKFNNF